MVHLIGLSKSYANQRVLRSVNWHVGPTDRVGLVGNNGSGKTTLMKLMARLETADEGEVSLAKALTVAYLPQDGVVHEGRSLFDEAASAFGEIRRLQEEERLLLADMKKSGGETPESRRQAQRLAEIHDQLRVRDGYQLERNVEKVLIGLGFGHDELDRSCEEFSGGWQMRIALAKILLTEPNLLLLDEPTNYLDLEARVFLERWLGEYPHAVVMVSHDRHFLDRVVTRITEVHDGRLGDYHCDYTRFLVEREERLGRFRAQAERVEAERRRIQLFIDRFRYKADKAALVQSRVKMLEKLEKVELPSLRKRINFAFPQPKRSGKVSLEAEGLSAGYGDGPDVFKNVEFRLARGDKAALVGINGAGKSTLIKVLAGELAPRSGRVKLGHNVGLDFFAQDIEKRLDPDMTVYETLEHGCPFDMVPHLRNLLGAFLFSGDDIDKKVFVLSGGERNRLALAKMLLVPSNLLLMDEPTNHLDLDAKEVLLGALEAFEGTLLFVSHDRYILDNLATRVFYLDDGELFVYPGGYPDFLHDLERRRLCDEGVMNEKESTPGAADEDKAAQKAERVKKWREEKRRRRELERLRKRVAALEEEAAEREAVIKALVYRMAAPHMATNFVELEKLSERKEELDGKLRAVLAEWEETLYRLEAFEGGGLSEA